MIDWSKIVSLTEHVRQEGLDGANLSDLALFTTKAPLKPEGFGEFGKYLNSADVANDFGYDSMPAKMAAKIFAQTPNIKAGNGSLIVIPMGKDEDKSAALLRVKDVKFFGIMFDDLVKDSDSSDLAKLAATVQAMDKVLFVVSNDFAVVEGAFTNIKESTQNKTRCLFYNRTEDVNTAKAKIAAADATLAAAKEAETAAKAALTDAEYAADAEETVVAAKTAIDAVSVEETVAAVKAAITEAKTAAKAAAEEAGVTTAADSETEEDAEVKAAKVAEKAKTAAEKATVAVAAAENALEEAAQEDKAALEALVDAVKAAEGKAIAASDAAAVAAKANSVEARPELDLAVKKAEMAVAAEAVKFATAEKAYKEAMPALTEALAQAEIAEKEAPLGFMAAYAGRGLATNFNGYGTAFTMQLKTLNGISPDNSIENKQYDALMAAGVDCYPSFGIAKVATSGANKFFDIVVYEMAIKLSYINSLFNSLATTPTKIAQTNAGLMQIKANAIKDLKKFQNCGVLASGVNWSSEVPIPVSEDAFQLGIFQDGMYLWFGDINEQSPADRNERKTPAGFLAIKFAGAFHSIESTISFEN